MATPGPDVVPAAVDGAPPVGASVDAMVADGARADAAPVDVAPAAQDARAADGGRDGGVPMAGSCARPTCGGDVTGSWDLVSWCSRTEGGGAATGTLVVTADGKYAWTITAGPPRLQAKPTAETGTLKVEGNMLVTKTVMANGAYFPPRGSFVYRGDLGASSVYCVDGDTLTVRAEEKVGFNWTLRRKR